AEDGIRDRTVTGVQTCALPISLQRPPRVTGFMLMDALIAGRFDVFTDALRHLVLPAVTLSLGGLATIVRFTRAGVLDTLQQDFEIGRASCRERVWSVGGAAAGR